MKYKEIYKELHRSKRYGISGDNIAEGLSKLVPESAETLLDYGAGQSNTASIIKRLKGLKEVREYDPCVQGRDQKPKEDFDALICTDVMEHIPEEELSDVITDIRSYSDYAVFVISTRLAGEILPNGENAHCTVRPDNWWKEQLEQHWDSVTPVPKMSKKYCYVCFVCS